MCGKCIEGCYLAGWRNGVYSFEHMQEEPDFMGNDVKAAHGLVEAVCSLGSSLNELHALGLADSPMIAWAGYERYKRRLISPLSVRALPRWALEERHRKNI